MSEMNIYFLGIGGIGMSALARWYNKNGASVYGYDLVKSPLTEQLSKEGIDIHYNDNPELIPNDISFVIYTPAVPKNNREFQYFCNSRITMYKRAEIIGNISNDYFTVAIAGTHGKTSITALAAHILKSAGLNITAFIGGICNNYHSNLILSETTDILVVEADEYDRSLLNINPDIAVVTSSDNDHLDIYKDNQDIKNTFISFAKKLPKNGILYYNSKLDFFSIPQNRYSYGTGSADVRATNIRIEDGTFIFDMIGEDKIIKNIKINVPGIHNIENTIAAMSIAISLGVETDKIIRGVETFKGVERRMEVKISNSDFVFIDDYAHHPKEIKATIEAVKMLFPEKEITVIFQPHLYSRTRDFADEFARELSAAQNVILMDIYPARELPISGISSQIIIDCMQHTNVKIMDKMSITKQITTNMPEVLLTLGAGDIGLFAKELESKINNI